jgi:hypothetical protein
MKNMLRISILLMVIAGFYGFIDMIRDVQDGKFIKYERDPAQNTSHNVKVAPVSFAALIKKGQLSALNSAMMEVSFRQAEPKKTEHHLQVSDLNVESFSRGDIRFEPEMMVVMDSIQTDSLNKEATGKIVSGIARTKPDSVKH